MWKEIERGLTEGLQKSNYFYLSAIFPKRMQAQAVGGLPPTNSWAFSRELKPNARWIWVQPGSLMYGNPPQLHSWLPSYFANPNTKVPHLFIWQRIPNENSTEEPTVTQREDLSTPHTPFSYGINKVMKEKKGGRGAQNRIEGPTWTNYKLTPKEMERI